MSAPLPALPSPVAALRRDMAGTFAAMDRTIYAIAAGAPQQPPACVAVLGSAGEPCQECGGALGPGRPERRFCSTQCRRDWNHRREARGADLYDLFMTLRYERGAARVLKVWRALCRMAEGWRREDVAARNGRRSWRDAREVLAEKVDLTTERGSTITAGRR